MAYPLSNNIVNHTEDKMLDTILTITLFALLFGSLVSLIYWWANKTKKKKVGNFGLKGPDHFGCH